TENRSEYPALKCWVALPGSWRGLRGLRPARHPERGRAMACVGVPVMRLSPSIVPGIDRDTYLVLDDFGGRLGLAWRETGIEDTDLGTIIRDLLDGQYSSPVRVVA